LAVKSTIGGQIGGQPVLKVRLRGRRPIKKMPSDQDFYRVEAMGIEPTNLLHAMQALYQLSYAPRRRA
jgi:hypothetical protein